VAEIEITLPTVQFGNIKLRLSPEEAGLGIDDPDLLGDWAAVYINLFTQGFKKGAARDVGAPVTASQEAAEPEGQEDADAPQADAEALLKDGLGATVVSEEPAPWKQEIAPKKKPWETGGEPTYQVGDTVEVAGMKFTKIADEVTGW